MMQLCDYCDDELNVQQHTRNMYNSGNRYLLPLERGYLILDIFFQMYAIVMAFIGLTYQ